MTKNATTTALMPKIILQFLSLRSAEPLWRWDGDTDSTTYKRIKKLGLAALLVENTDEAGRPLPASVPTYQTYITTDEEALEVYKILGIFPRTHYYKHKILDLLKKSNQLP
jgi:hypothetical protein